MVLLKVGKGHLGKLLIFMHNQMFYQWLEETEKIHWLYMGLTQFYSLPPSALAKINTFSESQFPCPYAGMVISLL